jgi:hypothetical protein
MLGLGRHCSKLMSCAVASGADVVSRRSFTVLISLLNGGSGHWLRSDIEYRDGVDETVGILTVRGVVSNIILAS